MSRVRLAGTFVLSLCVLVLIGWNLSDRSKQADKPQKDNTPHPTYRSQHTVTVVYNPEGKLSYKLVAENVEYYKDEQLSWFILPQMTLFDESNTASWTITSNAARLTKDKILYLYGNVQITSLIPTSQLEKVTTNNAQVNLATQDVSSDDEVTLHGINFTSTGMKMRGNLRSRNAELIEKVKTNYEITSAKSTP